MVHFRTGPGLGGVAVICFCDIGLSALQSEFENGFITIERVACSLQKDLEFWGGSKERLCGV